MCSGNAGIGIRGIRYISLCESNGYGMAARSYMKGLINQGIPLTWTPMVPTRKRGLGYRPYTGKSVSDPGLDPFCNIPIEYDTVIVHTVPEFYSFWADEEMGKRLVGYTVWETDRIPDHWPALLNRMGLVLVPTHWNKRVFEACGVTTPVQVIPHVYQPTVVGKQFANWGINEEDMVFYTINDWTARKAVWNTIRCYLNMFTAADSTLMVIKTSKYDFTRKNPWRRFSDTGAIIHRIQKHYPHPARLLVLNHRLRQMEINGLHQRGDCYVSLCHSEGWGLGAFDAAGWGNPVIITGFGGPLEYLPPDAGLLVKSRLVSVRDRAGRISYSSEQHWGQPDLDEASQYMKWIVNNPQEAKTRGELLKVHILKNFNQRVVIEKLVKVLQEDAFA